MNFQYEVRKKVEDYANAKPRPGFEVKYLMKAQDILMLYDNALEILENNPQNEDRLKEIIEEMEHII